jgi:hypothetical protein
MNCANLIFIYLSIVLNFVILAQEQQRECEVGSDGSCIGVANATIPSTLDSNTSTREPVVEIDKNCPDRGHIIRCTGEYLDLNKNGKLDRDELDSAIKSLPW